MLPCIAWEDLASWMSMSIKYGLCDYGLHMTDTVLYFYRKLCIVIRQYRNTGQLVPSPSATPNHRPFLVFVGPFDRKMDRPMNTILHKLNRVKCLIGSHFNLVIYLQR